MLNAHDLDFETIRPIDLNNGALTPGSKATPFSTLLWAVVLGDIAGASAQITDDIEWGLMPYNKVLKGKDEVLPWFRAGSADQKKPIVITNVATKDWGVFEYWNRGAVSEEVITFGNEQKWQWPKDPQSFVGAELQSCSMFRVSYQSGRQDRLHEAVSGYRKRLGTIYLEQAGSHLWKLEVVSSDCVALEPQSPLAQWTSFSLPLQHDFQPVRHKQAWLSR